MFMRKHKSTKIVTPSHRLLGSPVPRLIAVIALFVGVATLIVQTPSFAATLTGGQYLTSGEYITSPSGQFQLIMQSDGNLVEYTSTSNGYPMWYTGTSTSGDYVIMQTDGNLVVYTSGGTALWSSQTNGNPGAYLSVQTDGNMVIYSSGGSPLWSSGTASCTESGTNNCNRTTFAWAELGAWQGLNVPVWASNVFAMVTWEGAENTNASCNPLATTQSEPGSWNFNSAGVKNYQNYDGETCWYWGVYATLQTLNNGYYNNILSVLDNPNSSDYTQCVDLADAVGNSPWGTGNFSSDC